MIDTKENFEIDNVVFAHYRIVVTKKYVRTTSENKGEEKSEGSIFEEDSLYLYISEFHYCVMSYKYSLLPIYLNYRLKRFVWVFFWEG